ncbi:MAG: hypothetical protein HY922_08145 [Elusimicrobia bacterium]|nr:hypothetical protein [Elusimicrobiota bacterium]
MKGQVVYMYAYDVAYEIDLPKVRDYVRQRAQYLEVPSDKTMPRDFPFYKPLLIEEHPIVLQGPSGPLTLRREVKVFSIGALSISVRVDFDVRSLSDLLEYHALRLEGQRTVDDIAGGMAQQFLESIAPFLVKPSPGKRNPEAYTVFCIFDPGSERALTNARNWLRTHRREAAGLLSEEANFDQLSEEEVEETIRHSYCYTARDLIVIDWNSALIVDPDGKPDDLLYSIETANLQLTEYRTYDRLLEEGVDTAYDDIEDYTRKAYVIKGPGEILRRLRSMRMDLEKMSDELSNITKFFGDWHLARIYMACADRFHLKDWQRSVESKLRTLDSLYNLVLSDINNRRMLILEAAIVGLFIADLVLIVLNAR